MDEVRMVMDHLSKNGNIPIFGFISNDAILQIVSKGYIVISSSTDNPFIDKYQFIPA